MYPPLFSKTDLCKTSQEQFVGIINMSMAIRNMTMHGVVDFQAGIWLVDTFEMTSNFNYNLFPLPILAIIETSISIFISLST